MNFSCRLLSPVLLKERLVFPRTLVLYQFFPRILINSVYLLVAFSVIKGRNHCFGMLASVLKALRMPITETNVRDSWPVKYLPLCSIIIINTLNVRYHPPPPTHTHTHTQSHRACFHDLPYFTAVPCRTRRWILWTSILPCW